MGRRVLSKLYAAKNALTSTTLKKGQKRRLSKQTLFKHPNIRPRSPARPPKRGDRPSPRHGPAPNTDTNMQQHGNNHARKLADKMFMQNKIQNDTYAGMYMYEKANNSTYTHRNMVMTYRQTQRRPLTVCFFRGGQTILTTDSSGAQACRPVASRPRRMPATSVDASTGVSELASPWTTQAAPLTSRSRRRTSRRVTRNP